MDIAEIDENQMPLLFNGNAKIIKNEYVKGQNNVFLLEVEFFHERKQQLSPKAGQFYLIQSENSGVQFGRPISVYHSERDGLKQKVQFMILLKGKGTEELSKSAVGTDVKLIGPLGNYWKIPENVDENKNEVYK